MWHSQGLGKTLTSLVHIMATRKPGDFPTLVVCSKTVMLEWKSHAQLFFDGRLRVLLLHSDFTDVEKVDRARIMGVDVVVTTYDVCVHVCRRNNVRCVSAPLGRR
jgi:hypothetical protein